MEQKLRKLGNPGGKHFGPEVGVKSLKLSEPQFPQL